MKLKRFNEADKLVNISNERVEEIIDDLSLISDEIDSKSKDINKMKIFNKMYTIQSKLSIAGMDVLNNTLYKRNQTQYEEFIKSDTFMCVDWFKKNLYVPKKYAYPFFQGSFELDEELRKYGVVDIYGERQSL